MASRGYDRDGSQHDAVVSNLMDLQARLRGDPASLVLPRDGRRDDATTVRHDDLSVTVGNDERDAERRIEALKRRLEYLELEIDAYQHAASEAQVGQPSEPIRTDVGELQHVVEERLMMPDEDDVAAERTPRRPGGPEPALTVRADREDIDPAALVRLLDVTGGDKEFVGDLVEQFLNDAPGLVDAVRRGVAAGEIGDVRRSAHSLKSSAATFGARDLADRSRELEDAAKREALDDAESQIERIADELQNVRSELPAAWERVVAPPMG